MAAILYLVTNPVTGKSLPVATQPDKRLQYMKTQVSSVGGERQQDAGFFFLQASVESVEFFKWEELERNDEALTGQVFGHKVKAMIKTGAYYKPTEAFKQLCLLEKKVGNKSKRTNPGTHGDNDGRQDESSEVEVQDTIARRREEIIGSIIKKMESFGWRDTTANVGNICIDTPRGLDTVYRLAVVRTKKGGFMIDMINLADSASFTRLKVNDSVFVLKTQEEAKEIGLRMIALQLVDGLL